MRRGYECATVAGAHKMLRVISSVLGSKTLYRDSETGHEALIVQRNAVSWIWMLKRFGIDPTTGEIVQPAHA